MCWNCLRQKIRKITGPYCTGHVSSVRIPCLFGRDHMQMCKMKVGSWRLHVSVTESLIWVVYPTTSEVGKWCDVTPVRMVQIWLSWLLMFSMWTWQSYCCFFYWLNISIMIHRGPFIFCVKKATFENWWGLRIDSCRQYSCRQYTCCILA
jgi:hypothetical protein